MGTPPIILNIKDVQQAMPTRIELPNSKTAHCTTRFGCDPLLRNRPIRNVDSLLPTLRLLAQECDTNLSSMLFNRRYKSIVSGDAILLANLELQAKHEFLTKGPQLTVDTGVCRYSIWICVVFLSSPPHPLLAESLNETALADTQRPHRDDLHPYTLRIPVTITSPQHSK